MNTRHEKKKTFISKGKSIFTQANKLVSVLCADGCSDVTVRRDYES